eukprot:gi/632973490/ref/XP_007903180.1/ PREDICTED: phosphatidylinositol phosphatase PTPRQ [Callorhinchus milii]
MKWKEALHFCESAATGAHLLDINTEEEHMLISSHLRSLNNYNMLWTGLNDIETERDLQWTDKSAYLRNIFEQNLPSNETDCFALQLNPIGPDYVLTEFYCFLSLPYICEYEVLPKNVRLELVDVQESRATFVWDDLQDSFTTESELFIWYQTTDENRHSYSILPNSTRILISGLYPGHLYYFALKLRDVAGAQITLSPILSLYTRPNPPRDVTSGKVSSTVLWFHWTPPDSSQNASFQRYFVTYIEFESNNQGTETARSEETSVVLRNLKPLHSYKVYVQTVAESGSLSCAEGPVLASTAPSPPAKVFINHEDVWEDRFIVNWEPPSEDIDEYYIQVKISESGDVVIEHSNSNINKTTFQCNFMIPGITYDIEVAMVKSEPRPVEIVVPIDVQTHSTVLYVGMPNIGSYDGLNVMYEDEIERTVAAKGDVNLTIENLVPGREYSFAMYTTSGNMKSKVYRVPVVKTCLAPPTNVREGRVTETSMELLWDKADGHFYQYEVLCTNCDMQLMVRKVKQEHAEFTHLAPGTLYNVSLRTEKEGYRDSTQVIQQIFTMPSPVEYFNYSKTSNSISVNWQEPADSCDGYNVTLSREKILQTIKLPVTHPRIYNFDNLTPGTIYFVTIHTTRSTKRSHPTTISVRTLPEPPADLEFVEQDENSAYLVWKSPRGQFDAFKLKYFLSRGNKAIYETTIHGNKFRIKDLIPGEEYIFQAVVSGATPGIDYTVTVSSVSSSFSKSVSRSFTTNESLPDPPYDIVDEPIGATAIMLAWSVPLSPSGRIFSYVVKYKEVCPVQQASFIQLMTNSETPEFLLNNLKPGTAYKIQVAAENGAGIGAFGNFRRVVTAESAPGAVSLLSATAVNHTTANVTWFLPQQPNGKITQFRIIVKFARSGKLSKNMTLKADLLFPNTLTQCEDDVSSSTTPSASLSTSASAGTAFQSVTSENPGRVALQSASVLVTHLNPYTTYLCEGSAFTKEGEGQITSALFRTPEWIPEEPPQNLVFRNLTSKSFIINWDPPLTITGRLFYRVELRGPSGRISYNTTRDLRFFFVNLLPFIKYEVIVTPETAVGPGPKANVTVITSPEVPGKVSHLTATEVEAESVTLEWRKPRQPNGVITRYRINVLLTKSQTSVQNIILTENLQEIDTSPEPVNTGSESSLQVIDLTSEQLSYVVRQLIPYTDYIIRVSAFTIVGEGPPTNISLKTQQHVPSSVQNIIYKNLTSTSILLFWDPPAFHNGVITHYTIYYAVAMDTKKAFHKVTVNTNVTLTDLKKYTIYKVRLTASTAIGESSLSERDNIFVQTLEDVPDGPPQNITYVHLSPSAVEVFFSPPTAPNGIIRFYTLYLIPLNGSEKRIINSTNVTAKITGLKTYEKYILKISASTSKGEGNQSESMYILTREDVPVSPPRSLASEQLSFTTVRLSWEPPLEPNGVILYYTVHVWSTTTQLTLNVTGTSALLTDLEHNREHHAFVTANTRHGDGGMKSNNITFRSSEGSPGEPPGNVSYVNISSTSVQVFWNSPYKPNGNLQYYTIYYRNTSGVFTLNVTDLDEEGSVENANVSAQLDNLTKFSHYQLWVTASTPLGDGNQTSEMIDVYTVEDVPEGAVQNITSQNISSTSVTISWLPPLQPNGKVFYHIFWDVGVLESHSQKFSKITTDTSIRIEGLQMSTDYMISVTPATSRGYSENTTTILHIRTDVGIPETSPANLTYRNLSTTAIQLSWNPISEMNDAILSYTIELNGPSGTNFSTTSRTSLTLTNLLPFTHYNVSVSANTSKGLGPSSSLTVLTEESVPSAPPQNLEIVNSSADSVLVRWKPSPKPNGLVQFYSFKIIESRNQSTFFKNTTAVLHEAYLTGFELPGEYYISVSAFTKVGNGNQFSNIVIFRTNNSETVQNLHCYASSWQSVTIQWDPPLQPNGNITHYILIFENHNQTVAPSYRAYTFTDLQANTSYQFSVVTATSVGEGKGTNCIVSTLPAAVPSAPRELEVVNIQSTFVTLRWKLPEIVPGYITFFRITVYLRSASCTDWETSGCVETEEVKDYTNGKEDDDDDTIETTVSGLKKFRWYRFRVAASTNADYGNYSAWVSAKTAAGYPDGPPENITVTAISHDTIVITWEQSAIITGPTSYLIDVITEDSQEFNITILKTVDQNKTCEIFGLKPFTRYSVTVIAFTGKEEEARVHGKASEPVIIRTLEAVPKGAPENFTLQEISDEVTKVYVSFIPPSNASGDINGYQAIIHKEGDTSDIRVDNLKIIDNNQSLIAVIEGLKGGNTYTIKVRAITGAGVGPQTSEQRVTMGIKAPPKPDQKPSVALDSSGVKSVKSTTIEIRMPNCYFRDDHGPVKTVQVIVTEIRGINNGNISTWYEAYLKKPKPYFANEGFANLSCDSKNKYRRSVNKETYIIGAEKSCQSVGSKGKICNGPLKPNKEYLFKFRATNFQMQFTDSEYSDPVRTLADGLSGRTIEIILAVTLCVLSIILLVVAIFVIARIRQKQKEGGTYSPREAEIIDTKSKLDQTIAVADLELKEETLTRYSSLFFRRKEIFVIQLLSYRKSLKPVNKKSFLQHVEDLCVNNNLKFQEEFSELPKVGQELTSSDADLPWNRSKNRFANIKPYNNNRVKLMLEAGIPGSDFINASYVSGYLCPNEFIASQGPLPGTVADFWRMIWETSSKSIIMLTQCFEKGRVSF